MHTGCHALAIQGSSRCEQHTKSKNQAAEQRRTRYTGYKTSRWQYMRLQQLQREPLCAICRANGDYVSATVADHIKPHKGDARLFYDADNLQSLCKQCHDRKTATEDGGFGRCHNT